MAKILINGRGASGKDTFADYLVENHGYTKIAFADGIYDIAYDLFGMEAKDRLLLQQIGQKMREIDPDIWVSTTYERAKHIDKVIISDCRQLNEYEWGLRRGFIPIRVSCDEGERIRRLEERDGFPPDVSLLNNATENGADKCTFIEVNNDKDLSFLYRQAEEVATNPNDYKNIALRIADKVI